MGTMSRRFLGYVRALGRQLAPKVEQKKWTQLSGIPNSINYRGSNMYQKNHKKRW